MDQPDYNKVPEKPYWPPVTADVEAAIGRIVISWGVLEFQLDAIIAQLMRVSFATGHAVSANFPAQQKLNSVRALAHLHLKDDEHPKFHWNRLVERIDKLAAKTSGAATEWRNLLAHGQPFPVGLGPANDELESDEELVGEDLIHVWSHMAAGKGGVTGRIYILKPEVFEKGAAEVRALVDAWHQIRLDLVTPVEVMNFSDDRRE